MLLARALAPTSVPPSATPFSLPAAGAKSRVAADEKARRSSSSPRRATQIHSQTYLSPETLQLRQGAAVLAGSVLLDSAMEHLRGGWHNRAMYAAPLASLAVLAAATRSQRRVGHFVGIVVGTGGLGFHLVNILKRPGGLCWNNLFYAAPLGAPGALATAGLLGLAAARQERHDAAQWRARALLGFVGTTLWAETAEVWLLHFRGAFHNPAMLLPVAVPPLAGAALLARAACPKTRLRARALLSATFALGLLGTGFHVYGVSRNMGGWRNWRQNTLAGPPVPAPISFSGLALAGIAALDLMDRTAEERQ